MALWDDLAAARKTVADLAARLAAAQTRLAELEAMAVGGGPDISEFQGDIDWPAVRGAGHAFAFCRVSDGDRRDIKMNRARADAVRAAGLALGTYHFGRVASAGNSERNGKSEAAMAVYFAESVGALRKGDLPLAYDFETTNGQSPAKAARHAVEFIEAYRYLKGHPPILYAPPAFLAETLPTLDDAGRASFAACPLWIAHWEVAKPTVPAPWATSGWAFWQHTDRGTTPGIAGGVDLNRFSGGKAELAALLIP